MKAFIAFFRSLLRTTRPLRGYWYKSGEHPLHYDCYWGRGNDWWGMKRWMDFEGDIETRYGFPGPLFLHLPFLSSYQPVGRDTKSWRFVPGKFFVRIRGLYQAMDIVLNFGPQPKAFMKALVWGIWYKTPELEDYA